MGEKDNETDNGLPVYECQPPTWLPAIHGAADLGAYDSHGEFVKGTESQTLGYPGFHPPKPGQDEDILSAKHVKEGFAMSNPVNVRNVAVGRLLRACSLRPGKG
jgi:mediator of RNA polymerase II transcription subunit 12, fungi type